MSVEELQDDVRLAFDAEKPPRAVSVVGIDVASGRDATAIVGVSFRSKVSRVHLVLTYERPLDKTLVGRIVDGALARLARVCPKCGQTKRTTLKLCRSCFRSTTQFKARRKRGRV